MMCYKHLSKAEVIETIDKMRNAKLNMVNQQITESSTFVRAEDEDKILKLSPTRDFSPQKRNAYSSYAGKRSHTQQR